MSKQVVVYSSGFIGYDVGWPIVRDEETFDASVALARFSSSSTKEKLVIANPILVELFKQWRTRTRTTTQADFISDVICAVANAFGTTSFYEWCYMQTMNPYFTAYHRQYLNETLGFVFLGERRTISYPTWSTLLTPTIATREDAKERFLYQDILIGTGHVSDGDSAPITEVIQKWMRCPGGVDDMLVTATMLFGKV